MESIHIIFQFTYALTHRDYYDKGARLTVELFTDRVEITNPGGLVSAISQEEFGFKSLSRNPLIFGLFERMDMVEQIGSGINRMRNAMKSADLSEPVFKTEGMFTVVITRPIVKSGVKSGVKSWEESKAHIENKYGNVLNKTEWAILELMYANNKIAIPELSKRISLGTTAIENNIKKLKAKDVLERVGSAKGGYWKIKK